MVYRQLLAENKVRVVEWSEVPEWCQFTPERARQLYGQWPSRVANQLIAAATRNFEDRDGKCVAVITAHLAYGNLPWIEPCRHPARAGKKYCGYHLRKERDNARRYGECERLS